MAHIDQSRRRLLKQTASIGLFTILPSGLLSAAPNSRLQTAHVGVGGMGAADLRSVSSHASVAVLGLCDVDQARLKIANELHAAAKTYSDYREMIAELGDQIDAVVVSTPDHTHAPAAMTALNAGKPVYCQKPLTHTVFEARQLRKMAKKAGVPTQMGVQGHSGAIYRKAVKIVQSGVLGPVSEVHAWSFKNWGDDRTELPSAEQAPANLDWNRWLGTAVERDFAPSIYHPREWRKQVDFGTGTLGDMGIHIFDTPYTALQLGSPLTVKTTCRNPTGIGHPEKNRVEYIFPGTKYTTTTLRWTWSDGAFAPPTPKRLGLPEDFELPNQGSYFVGERGSMLLPHIAEPRLFPADAFVDYKMPSVEDGNHYHQWVDACLGKGQTSADFSYAGALTEALLLGVVANRFPGVELQWNARSGKVTNVPAANELLRDNYRGGFAVDNL